MSENGSTFLAGTTEIPPPAPATGPRRTKGARRLRWALSVLLAAYALLCVLTLRPGQVGGDFALYILHARNLALGVPYATTGFVYDPLNAIMSPASYPPGFPLLIAPVYAVAGLDLLAFKLVIVAALVALLPILYALFRPVTGPILAAVTSAAAGLMPDLFDRRDTIQSEIPFTFWCFAALLCYDRIRNGRGRAGFLILALAVSVAMACATRTAGVPLAAALGLICVTRRQGPWRLMLAASVAGAAAAMLAGRLLHVDSGTYLSYFDGIRQQGPVAFLQGALGAYGQGLVGAWGLSFGRLANAALLLILVVLLALGWVLRMREDASAPEAFLLLYAAMLVLFPIRSEPVRYLAPVAPLLVYYPTVAARWLFARAGRVRFAPPAVAVGWAVVFLPVLCPGQPDDVRQAATRDRRRQPGSLCHDPDHHRPGRPDPVGASASADADDRAAGGDLARQSDARQLLGLRCAVQGRLGGGGDSGLPFLRSRGTGDRGGTGRRHASLGQWPLSALAPAALIPRIDPPNETS